MKDKITIAIDAMGGENSPDKNIHGLSIFLKKNKNLNDYFFNIYGDEKLITDKIKKYKIQNNNFKIHHTSTIVSDEETPLTAIKNAKDSSMWKTINSQISDGSNISLSAGNTGVLFVISRMILKTMEKINKPALAAVWPNKINETVFLDLGANIDCDENDLVDFSKMGSALYKSLFKEETPNVALLNIGSEEIKGTETLKKAHAKLKNLNKTEDFNFNGYIEGDKIFNGHTNVIISDGFTGNIALKTAEGTAKFLTDSLKKTLTENIFTKFLSIFSYFSLNKFKKKLDPRKYNGAIFLGLMGPVVKSHGATDYLGFYYSIDLCYRIIKGDMMNKIRNNLDNIDATK